MKATSISRRLLTRVLSVYFILTFVVTCGQIIAEYFNTKSHIVSELLTLEKTFSGSLTRAVWELNTQQAIDIADGLVAIPMIKGISVTDENNQVITQLGEIVDSSLVTYEVSADNNQDYQRISSASEGLFGHTFPLIFEFSGRTTKVGSVTLLSSNEVIFNRIEVGIYFLIGNAIVKTAFLVFLFTLAFNKLLSKPLQSMTEQIKQFDIDDPEASKLNTHNYEQNELNVLEQAYNNLIDELVLYKDQLADAQREILSANQKLDEQNLLLEQEVARKTSSLSTTMLEMERQQRELLSQKEKLTAENNKRRQTELTLTQTNKELKSSILELNKAQEILLNSEKMVTLGNLSAEVSHEINTPIGVSITSTSYLSDQLNKILADVEENKISKRAFSEFASNARHSIDLIMNNLTRASELISSFKQIAVDQTSDKVRKLKLAKYLDEIVQSLHPKLKKTNHTLRIDCDKDIEIYTHAGAIAQIITNMIINSIVHGFDGINRGEIKISVTQRNQRIHLCYQDNGLGMSSDRLEHLFDPFYTTKLDQGGSGLGAHIIRNLVVNTLEGEIKAYSEPNQGLRYEFEFSSLPKPSI